MRTFLAAVVATAGLAAACDSANDTTPAPPPAAAETRPADGGIPGDGTFRVGSEVKPGTYRSAGGELCYWARLKGTSGQAGDIITNGTTTGPARVTIAKTDRAFETQGCGEWKPAR